MKQLIVIEGPTASGKTDLSVSLAQHFLTLILSADSRQFYRELSIGTAKPSLSEQQGIHHYFIDSHSIFEDVTAATYAKEALVILQKEFLTHDTLIMVGGSGMFIDALCYGLDEIPTSKELRDELTLLVEEQGLDVLLQELKKKDPEYFDQVDQKNPVRIIRAIEAIRLSNRPYSEMRKSKKHQHPFSIHRFVIDHPREQLYERINSRVEQMIENGLIEEVKGVYNNRHLNALNTVGYSEIFNYLDEKVTLSEAIELIKQNTRRYAKRQLTWFRKHEDAVWIPFDTTKKMTEEILKALNPH